MTTILTIDTHSEICRVGLSHADRLYVREQSGFKDHASIVLSFLDELLIEAKISIKDINKIVFVKGPGSFTGLRISACVAQGLAVSNDIPVIGISSLQAIAHGAYRKKLASKVWVIIDARMKEVYHAPFAFKNGGMLPVQDEKVGCLSSINFNDAYHYVGFCTESQQFKNIIIDCEDLLVLAQGMSPCSPDRALPSYIRNNVAQKKGANNG